jgi:hypothetical protein
VELYKNKQRENFKIYLVLPETACFPQREGEMAQVLLILASFYIYQYGRQDKV